MKTQMHNVKMRYHLTTRLIQQDGLLEIILEHRIQYNMITLGANGSIASFHLAGMAGFLFWYISWLGNLFFFLKEYRDI